MTRTGNVSPKGAEIGEIMKTLRAVLIASAVSTALIGCERMGNPLEALGGRLPPPDEFRVVTRKPLNMPASLSLSLPEPRPGARSPLEHDPPADAASALMAGRTLPGSTGAGAGAGEKALLAAANANAGNAEISARLDAAEKAATAGKPYEAPTLLEYLNLDGQRAEDILDADAESRRILRDGVAAAPVNPADKPDDETDE